MGSTLPLLVGLFGALTLLFLVMSFRYVMNIRARRRQEAFDLEWQLVPYDFKVGWHTKPENLTEADLLNIDKAVEIPPKIKDTHSGDL